MGPQKMVSFIESQFEWIKTFDCCKNLRNLHELTDGIQIANVLGQISPSHFNEEWFSKLKQDPENWRLRVSNLKKILDKVNDYYDHLMPAYPNIEMPDLNKIGKDNDNNELARLIQLVLGIAVNCEHKHQYIGNITKLDLSIQQNLMEAIQQLMCNGQPQQQQQQQQPQNQSQQQQQQQQNQQSTVDYAYTNGLTASNQSNHQLTNHHTNTFLDSLTLNESNYHLQEQFLRTMENLRITNEKKEAILAQNYELNKRLIEEQNEKLSLQAEYDKLLEKYSELNAKQEEFESEEGGELRNKQEIKLLKRIEQLEKDMIFLETQKEENLIKLELVEKEVIELRLINESLQRKAKETQFLQDELDEHKHSQDKILKYEQKLDIYQKKIEEFANFKREYNLLEKKNVELVTKNLELEEELKKPSILKQQILDYKKKIQELHQDIVEKTRNCDKLEFDLERQSNNFDDLNRVKLIIEKENFELKSRLKQLDKTNSLNSVLLKDEVDSFSTLNGHHEIGQNVSDQGHKLMNNCLNFEINEFSNDLKEKLTRVELENRLLKARLEEMNQEAVLLLRTSYEDAKTRVNELEKDNRKLNRTIVGLESKLNDMSAIDQNQSTTSNASQSPSTAHHAQSSSPGQYAKLKELEEQLRGKMKTISLFNDQIYDLEQKIRKLEGQLSKKDDEFNEMEAKYKKYLLKAKQAVSFLEPISAHLNSLSSLSPSNSSVNSIIHQQQPLPDGTQMSNGRVTNNQNSSNNQNGNLYSNSRNGLTPEQIYATNDVNLLKEVLAERDMKINEMTLAHERERNLKEMEQRLITVAFHNLAFSNHHKAATLRILQNQQSVHQHSQQQDNLTTSSSNGSLLLSKQRLPTRRVNNLNNNLI